MLQWSETWKVIMYFTSKIKENEIRNVNTFVDINQFSLHVEII